jgi:glycosyltransferase involved in cell wall biosynthesis
MRAQMEIHDGSANLPGEPRRWLVDTRWIRPNGIGRFAAEVFARLPEAEAMPRGCRHLSLLDPFWLSQVLWHRRPSVYFSPGFNPPAFSAVPFVFTISDLTYLQYATGATPLKRAYYRWLMRPACHRAFRVLTISEFSRRQIISWASLASDRVINVSCGVNSNYAHEGDAYNPGFRYLLYVGNRKPHKNLPRLLEAFATARMDSGIKLLVSGDSDREIAQRIDSLQISGRVVFAGKIPEEKMPALYRGAQALILVSLIEGFGLPIVEAMACGTPVVASNVTAHPEVAGGAAQLVDPFDSRSISHGIEQIVNDPVKRARLSVRGLERARQFSWESTALRVREVLEQAVHTTVRGVSSFRRNHATE